MKYTFSIILLVVISINSYAIGKYRKGYITLLNNDTIEGYLLYQNSSNASKVCVFKKSIDDSPTNYYPKDIHSYRYSDDKYYVSKEIPNGSGNKKIVFMEFLINGILDIYYYKDISGNHYFIEKGKTGLMELTESKYTYDGAEMVSKRYKGELKSAMADCPDIDSEIEKTDLNPQSLINLGKNYHEKVCTSESCIIYERKKLSAKFNFGLIAGLSMNKYNFGNRLLSSTEPCYQIGIGMRIENILYSNERFRLDIKLLLEKDSKYLMSTSSDYQYNYTVSYNGIEYNLNSKNAFNTIPNLSVDLNVIDLKIPIVIDYCYPLKNSSVYMGIGLSNKIIVHRNKQFINYAFDNQYGKSINTFLTGGILNIGFDRYLKKRQAIGINLNYEYLLVPNAVNTFLRLRENQITLQIIYSFL